MDKVYLDPNIFIINNFVSIEEKELLLAMDTVTQDVIKKRLSMLFDNTLDVVGSGVLRSKLQGHKELPHADQHPLQCECISCTTKGLERPTWTATAAIYLNKDYVGGTIHYINQDISYDPKELDLLVHPASEEYTHETLPIIDGCKQMVLFFYKPKM